RRQLRWAELKGELRGLVDRGGPGKALGEELLTFTEDVFHWWYRVRDGTLSRASMRTYIAEQRPWLRALLARGRACGCAKAAALCAGLLCWEPALAGRKLRLKARTRWSQDCLVGLGRVGSHQVTVECLTGRRAAAAQDHDHAVVSRVHHGKRGSPVVGRGVGH